MTGSKPAVLETPSDDYVQRLKARLFKAEAERQVLAEECDRLRSAQDLAAAPPQPPAPREQTQGNASDELPLTGRWHYGAGLLCSGSLRIARADFDTNPSEQSHQEVVDWITATLNNALCSHGSRSAKPAPQADARREALP